MRILHTSDWHLGRIFNNIHLTDDQSYILDQIKQIIREYNIDVIIVAGDIFDRAVPPPEAVTLLDNTLNDLLIDCKKNVIIISGNHDSPDRLSFGSRLFAHHGLHLFGNFQYPIPRITLHDNHGEVHFYAVPFTEPSIVRERCGKESIREHNDAMMTITQSITDTAIDNSRNIFCGHAFVQGGIIQESERPISVGGSGAVDLTNFSMFSCTLLGHLHKAQWFSAFPVHYCGSILPYSFSEIDHKKSVTVIDIDASGSYSYEYVPLTPRFAFRSISGMIDTILRDSVKDTSPNDYILVKLEDSVPVLDAIGKLRVVYPNIMAIERPGLEAIITSSQKSSIDHRTMTDDDLFRAFYKEVKGETMNDAQIEFLHSVFESLQNKEREVTL